MIRNKELRQEEKERRGKGEGKKDIFPNPAVMAGFFILLRYLLYTSTGLLSKT